MKKQRKVAIIGAGPAGSMLAGMLSSRGCEVRVFEEHGKAGVPEHCTGIMSDLFPSLYPLDRKYLLNTTDRTRIYSPSGEFLDISNRNYVIDRVAFDRHLAKEAVRCGARISYGARLTGMEDKDGLRLTFNTGEIVRTDLLVGADGPFSAVARLSGMFARRRFMYGIQARVQLENDNAVEFYPHVGTFGWVVPESREVVKIGVAAYSSARGIFDAFAQRRLGKARIISLFGGPIPVFSPYRSVRKGKVYLLGDAAAQVKATTGGGVIQCIIAARVLADSITGGKDYGRSLLRPVHKDLAIHLLMRKLMDRFSGRDWDLLIHKFNKEKMKRILAGTPRDRPGLLAGKLLLAEPSLALFALRFLRR